MISGFLKLPPSPKANYSYVWRPHDAFNNQSQTRRIFEHIVFIHFTVLEIHKWQLRKHKKQKTPNIPAIRLMTSLKSLICDQYIPEHMKYCLVDHWNFETEKPQNQYILKPRNVQTKKPRSQEANTLWNQENKQTRNQATCLFSSKGIPSTPTDSHPCTRPPSLGDAAEWGWVCWRCQANGPTRAHAAPWPQGKQRLLERVFQRLHDH